MIPDLHQYGHDDEPETVKAFLSDSHKKGIKSEIEQIVDSEFDRLEEYANEFICETAARRAEKFISRVLNGDNDAAKSLIDADGGRYRACGHDHGKPWASLIHGSLFETATVVLRRKIVEAHADLLRSQRIADLEATVEGLSIQIRELEADRDRWR